MKKLNFILMCMMMFMFLGCMNKNVVTDSGKKIPESFLNMYVLMDYSDQFSDVTGKITADLYSSNHITEDDKDQVGEIWKRHRKYHNMLQEEMEVWYNSINSGKTYTDKEKVMYLIGKLMNETKVLDEILLEYTEVGDLYMSILRKLFKLYNEIEGV